MSWGVLSFPEFFLKDSGEITKNLGRLGDLEGEIQTRDFLIMEHFC
jgi:hypothetical protein